MRSTKSLVFLSALVAAMCASSASIVQADEMTYGLKRQQAATSADTNTNTNAAASPDTANISPQRLAVMQRQKDKRGFSPYAARAGVNSINNPTVSTATTTTNSIAAASPDTANISPQRLAAMQRQKDKRGFSPYAARAGVNSINNPATTTATASTTAIIDAPAATDNVASTDSALAPVTATTTNTAANTNTADVMNTSTDPAAATAASVATTPVEAAPVEAARVTQTASTTYLRA